MKNKLFYLFPLLLFVILFLLSGVLLQDFYAISSVFWILIVLIFTFIFFEGTFENKFESFLDGVADKKILLMSVIFLLSGAFSSLCKEAGTIDYLTFLLFNYVPISLLFVGFFLLSCCLSFALGTSVGTIVALGPIAYQLAGDNQEAMAMLAGSLLGGAMFGDNLSFISDTTIAATQTMQVEMKDKFKANFILAGLAALFSCIVLFYYNVDFKQSIVEPTNSSYILLIPYFLIIFLALYGMHVVKVLLYACFSAMLLLLYFNFGFEAVTKSFYEGMHSMFEICILSLCIGGLVKLIEKAGGINYILETLQRFVNNKLNRVPFVVASLVSFVNICVANNTIALLISGPIAYKLATKYKVNKPKITSVLDIFSCIVQGVLPYGAQVLILLSFFNKEINYLELMQFSFYIWILLLVTIFSMYISFGKVRAN